MKIISDKLWKRHQELEILASKLTECHMHFGEFDWLLKPFWDYLKVVNGPCRNADHLREQMRKNHFDHIKELIKNVPVSRP